MLGPCSVSFVERFIILCPYLGGSTIGGSMHCSILKVDDDEVVQNLNRKTSFL